MGAVASEALLRWEGLPGNIWITEQEAEQEEESMEMLRSRLQAMASAAQARDAALLDSQKRLQAALEELEQGRSREAALRRRAEVAEAAEEALASQMGDLEAEAYASIAHNNKLLAAQRPLSDAQDRIAELERSLQVAAEEAAGWQRRCTDLEAEMAQRRVREAAFLQRLETAQAAEEALASQMAELEAEAYTRLTQHNNIESEQIEQRSAQERQAEAVEQIGDRQVAELQRRLAAAERALEAVEAKLRQAGEKEQRLKKTEGKRVTVKREGEVEAVQAPLSLSLQELAGMVKLRLWLPSSLALTSA